MTALPRQAARHIVFIGGGAIGGAISGGKAVVGLSFGAAHRLNILEGHQQHQRRRWRQAHCSTSPSRTPHCPHWRRRDRRRQGRREYPVGAARHLYMPKKQQRRHSGICSGVKTAAPHQAVRRLDLISRDGGAPDGSGKAAVRTLWNRSPFRLDRSATRAA